jgi:SAM-dependent methyltransferase
MNGSPLAPEIADYYDGKDESRRLLDAADGRLELIRTQELLRRALPNRPCEILDVGGGTGIHSAWLTADGHHCTLIDPMPKHVDAARAAGIEAVEGEARSLPFDDDSFDAVLLMGPLYHLPKPADRAAALVEAVRVARPGALIAAAAIGRFASLFENAGLALLGRPRVRDSVSGILATGELIKPPPGRFTTAFFHAPELLTAELTDAGAKGVQVFGVEGPAWGMLRAAEARGVTIGDAGDDPLFDSVLEAARMADYHPELLAAASHLLAIGFMPTG